MREFSVTMQVVVNIKVSDDRVISRPVENTDGWRDDLYDLKTEDAVLEHLAYNAAVNGHTNGTLLDGWADLPEDAISMKVNDADLWEVDEMRASG